MSAHTIGMDNLYLESAGTILSLVTIGKYLEARSKSKTGGAIERSSTSHLRPQPSWTSKVSRRW